MARTTDLRPLGNRGPAAVDGDDDARREAISKAFHQLNRRIGLFMSLPIRKLNAAALKHELDDIDRLRQQGE